MAFGVRVRATTDTASSRSSRLRIVRDPKPPPAPVTATVTGDGIDPSVRGTASGCGTPDGQRSTSPTTKNTDPRMAMRSGTSWPRSIHGRTDTFENDAVRIFRRYGNFLFAPTR
jgi:hypothetical protein